MTAAQGVPPPDLPLAGGGKSVPPPVSDALSNPKPAAMNPIKPVKPIKPVDKVESKSLTPPGGGVDAPDPFGVDEKTSPPPVPTSGLKPPSVADSTPLAPTAFQQPEQKPHRGRRKIILVIGGLVVLVLLGAIGVAAARLFLNRSADTTVEPATGLDDTATDAGTVIEPDDLLLDTGTEPGGDELIEPTTEPTSESVILDIDEDGLTVAEERFYGTDIEVADTDGDGFSDGDEVRAGYDPLGPGKLDSDNDGFPDPDEREFGSDPFNPDTDADGYSDGEEIDNGFNPLIPSPGDKL